MIKTDYTVLAGGLDLASSALNVKPGRLSDCLNFEQVFGRQGYRRISGYERFDGRSWPSKATYHTLEFDAGVTAITVGQTVTGASATATVLAVTLTSGVWGSTAAGVLVLGELSGAFVDNEAIKVSGVTVATANGPSEARSATASDHTTNLSLAVEARRALIQKPTGEGPILGVAIYKETVYCVRNNVGSLTAKMWKSSASGWTSVKDGLRPNGAYSFDVANFTGSSETLSLFGCDGINRPFRVDTAFTFLSPIFSSQATSTSSVTVGTGSKTFSIAETTRDWVVGTSLTVWSTSDAGKYMTGTVTGYTHPSVTINVTSSGGSGTATDWEIGSSTYSDKPRYLKTHKDRLWLAYPSGQLQASDVGDPMAYTGTSALFGVGDEITGITSMRGDLLGVFCEGKIALLAGSSPTDWQMQNHSTSSGAKFGTLAENVGNTIYLDDRGLTTLQSTQNFGSFEPSIFSRDVDSVVKSYASQVVCAVMHKDKYQYRVYMTDGSVLTASIMSAAASLQPTDVAFTRQQYLHTLSCVTSGNVGESADMIVFGTTDGWVMVSDVGTSFDGGAIDSSLRFHFNHFGGPSNKKRFRKLVLEMDAQDDTSIYFKQFFDFADGYRSNSLISTADTVGRGGTWESSSWDQFYWSKPLVSQAVARIDGVGVNMGLLMWHSSATAEPFVLQGLFLHYSPLGMAR